MKEVKVKYTTAPVENSCDLMPSYVVGVLIVMIAIDAPISYVQSNENWYTRLL